MHTSGRKVAKKARQVFRKNQAAYFGQALKPKPKWIPWFLYRKILGFVLNIDNR